MSIDKTRRPFAIPTEFSTYAEKYGLFDMMKRMTEKIMIAQPEDPIQWMIDYLQHDNDDVSRVILVGPPAAGKRTIAHLVANKLKCLHVTTENALEEASIELKSEAEKYLAAGKEVPPIVWANIFREKLSTFEAEHRGWILDDFPRTRPQCLALQSVGVMPRHVVHLELADTAVVERAEGKRVDPETKEIYHTTFDWPSDLVVSDRLKPVKGYSETEIVDRLMFYHRHSSEVMPCFNHCIKTISADQPKADVLMQVIHYLETVPRSLSPFTPRVLLLGPSGAGKHLQAQLLATKYNLVNISMGSLVKEHILQDTKLGNAARTYASKAMPGDPEGKDTLLPDTLVIDMITQRLGQLDCATRGWVITGYPANREQGEVLQSEGFAPNRVFIMDIPTESVLERLSQRVVDPVTGDSYHLMYNPPRNADVRDRLVARPRDHPDKIRVEVNAFSLFAEELEAFYKEAVRVNADQDPHTVFEFVESHVTKPTQKKLV